MAIRLPVEDSSHLIEQLMALLLVPEEKLEVEEEKAKAAFDQFRAVMQEKMQVVSIENQMLRDRLSVVEGEQREMDLLNAGRIIILEEKIALCEEDIRKMEQERITSLQQADARVAEIQASKMAAIQTLNLEVMPQWLRIVGAVCTFVSFIALVIRTKSTKQTGTGDDAERRDTSKR